MIKNGWLELDKPDKNIILQKKQSPHFDKRPNKNDISLLVIHNISLPPSQFSGNYIEDFFMGKLAVNKHPYFQEIASLRVSSHLLIRRDGSIIQFVPFDERAWHAGESDFQGRSCCNDFSIGIELEGTDNIEFTEQQYSRLTDVTKIIMQTYPLIKSDRIVGHCDIAPGRKTDPGEMFDWDKYLSRLS